MATEEQKEIAAHMRIIIKELGWVLQHLTCIYNLTKTEEEKVIEYHDPNQLEMSLEEGEKEK